MINKTSIDYIKEVIRLLASQGSSVMLITHHEEAVPRLKVINETAKLTHEAAIGSVDKKQVETLMARGLAEQEAVNVIVMGLLK